MAIPDFQSFMLPVLQLAEDGQVHSLTEHIAGRVKGRCILNFTPAGVN